MGQLENVRIFLKVVEAGSITQTSEQLGLAKSAISRRLSELEQQLGVTLINRTTRTSSVTEAGRMYYQKSKLILDEFEELNGEIAAVSTNLTGTLRLSLPLSFGVEHLGPLLEKFTGQHSEIMLDIDFSDRKVDIVEEGYDLAVRIGELADSTLRAKAITPIRHILCASPDYLEKYGTPRTPAKLKAHRFLSYNQLPLSGLPLIGPDNKLINVPVSTHHSANTGEFLKNMAVAGHGITYLPLFIVWRELAKGSLTQLLSDYSHPELKAYVIYPATRYLPQKSRVFIDFLTSSFEEGDYLHEKTHCVESNVIR